MKSLRRILHLIIAIGLVLYLSDEIHARAGRGQSYRSSSYRSSSSSYRSSSYRSSSSSRSSRSSYSGYHRSSYGTSYSHSGYTKDAGWYVLLWFLIAGVVIFALIYAAYRYRRRYSADSGRSASEPPRDASERIVALLAGSDPNFSLETFLERVKETFLRVQQAWSAGDMSPVRNLLSQGVYNRFKIQLEIMRGVEGVTNIMDDVQVQSVRPIDVSVNGPYVTIHAAVSASARDVTIPSNAGDDEARRLLQKASISAFTEVYSFTRSLSSQSDPDKDLLKGQCPRCGFVPDNFSQVNKCPSCGALYNSGLYDWVLSEITQLEEWRPSSAGEVSGLPANMSRQVIEDRASYIFWRWIQSRVRGDALPLSRDATEKMKSHLMSLQPEHLKAVAVGAVDLKGVGMENSEYRADILVQWSASTASSEEPVHFDHQLYLVFRGENTADTGFADHGCVQCGAPLPDTDSLECEYCGAKLPETNEDWLLDEIK